MKYEGSTTTEQNIDDLLMAIETEVKEPFGNMDEEIAIDTMLDDVEIDVDFLTDLLESKVFPVLEVELNSVNNGSSNLGKSHSKKVNEDSTGPLDLSTKQGTMEPMESSEVQKIVAPKSHKLRMTLPCGNCKRKFAYLATWTNHKRNCPSRPKYECPICGKKFRRIKEILKHEKLHGVNAITKLITN